MLDDFFIRALVAGIGIAICVGPLGCIVVWRRMSYFGDTMAHSSLLGVAFAFMFDVSLIIGVFGVALLVSFILLGLQKTQILTNGCIIGDFVTFCFGHRIGFSRFYELGAY